MATFEQRNSGYWQAKIRRRGHIASKTFRTKTEADAWARQVEAEIDRGIWHNNREAEATSLKEALKRYKREVTPTKRGAATEEYRINAWMEHKLAKKPLAALRGADFAEHRDERLAAGCAGSTVQKELALISSVYETARREWGMEALVNPLRAVRKPAAAAGRDRVFIADEETRLLNACTPQTRDRGQFAAGAVSPMLQPVVRLALETAMRQGELAGLLWENIDLNAQVARLPMTKNGTARNVPLSSTAVSILRGLPGNTENVKTLRRGPVFGLTPNAIKIAFGRAVKRARKAYESECKAAKTKPDPHIMVDFTFHDLRHVATTRLAEKLPNVIELAAVTGHKDLRMLKRYYHPRAEDLAKKLG